MYDSPKVEEFARNGGEIEKEIGGRVRKERGKMGMEESGSMKTESGSKRHWKWRKIVNLVVFGFLDSISSDSFI